MGMIRIAVATTTTAGVAAGNRTAFLEGKAGGPLDRRSPPSHAADPNGWLNLGEFWSK